MRAHHLRAVGGDRERDAVLDERAERVAHLVLVAQRLRQQVRRRADLEHDPGLAQRGHQLRLAGREDAVADPVGPQRLDHLADLLDAVLAALLADVDRHAEAGRARLVDQRRQRRRTGSARRPAAGPAMSTPTIPRGA